MRTGSRWRNGAALVCAYGLNVAVRADLPAGFELSTFADGFHEPIAIQFAPDGRLLVAERAGAVRIVEDGSVSGPIATVDVFRENENGLLGMTLDPDFAVNRWVYVFATVSPQESRILRFTAPQSMDAAGGTGLSEHEMTVIRDTLPTRGTFHSGGGLAFGPDGRLYFSIGDNLVEDNAQDMNTLAGKIARINADGSVPADNPFRTVTDQPRAVFALGFRNPFRFCFAPDGRLFVLDVGSDGDRRREEVNLVRAGDNCGWPLVEGRPSEPIDPRFRDPIFEYHDGGAAPVGCVVYSGQQFPEAYRGNLFFLEFVLNRLYRLELSEDRVTFSEVFYQGENGPVDLTQGPDGALYFCELYSGAVRRLSFAGAAAVAGTSVTGAAGDGSAGSAAADDLEAPSDAVAGAAGPLLCGSGGLWGLTALALLPCIARCHTLRATAHSGYDP